MTSLKNEVTQQMRLHFRVLRDVLKNVMKAELGYLSYMLFLTVIRHFSSGIFLKPMWMYDQGIVKIQKMRK